MSKIALPKPEKEKKPGLASKVLLVATYPIAALVGWWSAMVTAHSGAYNTAKSLGAFDDILATATPKSRADIQEFVAGNINQKEFWRRAMESKKAYQTAAHARMDDMGLIKNLRNKWRYMPKANRDSVVKSGLASAGITLGALLSVAESRILDKIFPQSSKEEAQR